MTIRVTSVMVSIAVVMAMESRMRYGYDFDRIEEARLKAGLSKRDLAQKAGVTAPTVGNLFIHRTANPATVAKIAEVLGLNLAELVIRKDETAEVAK